MNMDYIFYPIGIISIILFIWVVYNEIKMFREENDT